MFFTGNKIQFQINVKEGWYPLARGLCCPLILCAIKTSVSKILGRTNPKLDVIITSKNSQETHITITP